MPDMVLVICANSPTEEAEVGSCLRFALLGDEGLPKVPPVSILILHQSLKAPCLHNLECFKDSVLCAKILCAHSILHLSSTGAF